MGLGKERKQAGNVRGGVELENCLTLFSQGVACRDSHLKAAVLSDMK